MRSVWIFFSASAAARLTAVVVLPTPPFWLAMVKTVVGMKGGTVGHDKWPVGRQAWRQGISEERGPGGLKIISALARRFFSCNVSAS
jgi:hypothetical protein